MSEPVRVARYLASTLAEGPGRRTAVWVQGCAIRCVGCFNPHMWSSAGGVPYDPVDLAARVVASGTEGLTLLGGEPFDQAPAVAVLAAAVREGGRSVMTFTGYTYAHLRRSPGPGVADLLAATDLLVAGPFLRDRLDYERPWVGSTNQEFVVLSRRFPALVSDFASGADRVEVSVDASGEVRVNGWLDSERLDALVAELGR